jgi:hypothetical protein
MAERSEEDLSRCIAIYDRIGRGYREVRRPDPRIAARIEAALGDAESVLNGRPVRRLSKDGLSCALWDS